MRLGGLRFGRCAFDGARLEIDFAAGVERHESADGKRSGDRGDQAFDAILVPDPTSLKVRKLHYSTLTFIEELVQINRIRLERRAGHEFCLLCCRVIFWANPFDGVT